MAPESKDIAVARIGDQLDLARLPRLETDRCTGRDVEPESARPRSAATAAAAAPSNVDMSPALPVTELGADDDDGGS